MKQASILQPIDDRLSAYQKQAQQYATKSRHVHKRTKIGKNTLMALVPLAATSMLPNLTAAQSGGCSFSQMFTITASAQIFTIDLPHNTQAPDFKIIYSNTTAGFKGLVAGVYGMGTNYIQQTVTTIGVTNFDVVPRLDAGDSINPTNNFTAISNASVYATSAGVIVASPATPLDYPEYIAIRSGGHYGFLSISISGNQLTVVGGVDTSTTDPSGVVIGQCASLPVELTTFDAWQEENAIHLSWETATEIDNRGFELERSTDGKNFQKIAWVEGNGTTLEAQQYQHKDDKVVANELYYYRLMQVDIGGKTTYSKIITAELKDLKQDNVGEVFPNPVSDALRVPITATDEKDARLTLFDSQGRALKHETATLNQGANEILFDMTEIVIGNYFMKIELESQVVYRKVAKI